MSRTFIYIIINLFIFLVAFRSVISKAKKKNLMNLNFIFNEENNICSLKTFIVRILSNIVHYLRDY